MEKVKDISKIRGIRPDVGNMEEDYGRKDSVNDCG